MRRGQKWTATRRRPDGTADSGDGSLKRRQNVVVEAVGLEGRDGFADLRPGNGVDPTERSNNPIVEIRV